MSIGTKLMIAAGFRCPGKKTILRGFCGLHNDTSLPRRPQNPLCRGLHRGTPEPKPSKPAEPRSRFRLRSRSGSELLPPESRNRIDSTRTESRSRVLQGFGGFVQRGTGPAAERIRRIVRQPSSFSANAMPPSDMMFSLNHRAVANLQGPRSYSENVWRLHIRLWQAPTGAPTA